jgi:SAM-dependent methyltransferase
MLSGDLQMSHEQSITSKLIRRYYRETQSDILYTAFCSYVKPGTKVLDAGCGYTLSCSREGPWPDIYIVGVDQDPAAHSNPFCNETLICDLKTLPFADATFDLIHCRWVIEHLEDPLSVFYEFARVLKPGGHLLALTSNIYHYATIAAKLTPYWFHRRWWPGRPLEPCPTYFRANSPRGLRRLCANVGLNIRRLELNEGLPVYLVRCWPAFLGGVLYERIVNSTRVLECIRHTIFLDAFMKSKHTHHNKL